MKDSSAKETEGGSAENSRTDLKNKKCSRKDALLLEDCVPQ